MANKNYRQGSIEMIYKGHEIYIETEAIARYGLDENGNEIGEPQYTELGQGGRYYSDALDEPEGFRSLEGIKEAIDEGLLI